MTARSRNERGAAYAEYTPLLAVIALVVIFSVAFLGPWVASHVGIAGLSITQGDYLAGECPSGNWLLTPDDDDALDKKNGQDVNVNGDGYLCDKDIPGGGNGNTDQNHNVKDNNSYPWDP